MISSRVESLHIDVYFAACKCLLIEAKTNIFVGHVKLLYTPIKLKRRGKGVGVVDGQQVNNAVLPLVGPKGWRRLG